MGTCPLCARRVDVADEMLLGRRQWYRDEGIHDLMLTRGGRDCCAICESDLTTTEAVMFRVDTTLRDINLER